MSYYPTIDRLAVNGLGTPAEDQAAAARAAAIEHARATQLQIIASQAQQSSALQAQQAAASQAQSTAAQAASSQPIVADLKPLPPQMDPMMTATAPKTRLTKPVLIGIAAVSTVVVVGGVWFATRKRAS